MTVVAFAILGGLVFAGSALAVSIDSYSPTSGLPAKSDGTACPGGTITLTGSGFVSDGAAGGGSVVVGKPTTSISVKFNGTPSTWVEVGSDDTLYAVVPDGATTGPITVTTGKGTASTAQITGMAVGRSFAPQGVFYVNPCPQVGLADATTSNVAGVPPTPTIYKVKPVKAKAGATVTLTGTSFLGVNGVQVGGVAAKYVIVSPTSITFTVPKKATSGALTLTYSITASTSQGGTSPTNAAGNSSSAKSVVTWENIRLGKARTFTVSK
ncbi:MAG TPA: IPT/TIG domain-containing protein [Gaiellaceae bacterium]|nr:IPT/TIG domain-containing protein [Gaiellaceae bacterium]